MAFSTGKMPKRDRDRMNRYARATMGRSTLQEPRRVRGVFHIRNGGALRQPECLGAGMLANRFLKGPQNSARVSCEAREVETSPRFRHRPIHLAGAESRVASCSVRLHPTRRDKAQYAAAQKIRSHSHTVHSASPIGAIGAHSCKLCRSRTPLRSFSSLVNVAPNCSLAFTDVLHRGCKGI